jgi:hypothetical protein
MTLTLTHGGTTAARTLARCGHTEKMARVGLRWQLQKGGRKGIEKKEEACLLPSI